MSSLPPEPRALQDPTLRRARAEAAFTAPHVKPLNELVLEIETEQAATNLPLIDPTFGGTNARVLLMLKAPEGDATPRDHRAQFLSLDNDDPTAADYFQLTRDAGLDRTDLVAWNICPFPAEGKDPTATEVKRASRYHRRLFALLPKLEVIIWFGGVADKFKVHVPNRGAAKQLICHLPNSRNRPSPRTGISQNPESWATISRALAEAHAILDAH